MWFRENEIKVHYWPCSQLRALQCLIWSEVRELKRTCTEALNVVPMFDGQNVRKPRCLSRTNSRCFSIPFIVCTNLKSYYVTSDELKFWWKWFQFCIPKQYTMIHIKTYKLPHISYMSKWGTIRTTKTSRRFWRIPCPDQSFLNVNYVEKTG